MTDSAPDLVYETVAAFAAGLVEHGVVDVVISPGSRSTPLAITLHAQPRLRTWIQIDERSAGFFALGQAKATGRPSVLVCTSGTAAANYLPAVVEAHASGVPLIVCTADRPPELRDRGAGQTIDQVGIYGSATRWAFDMPVAGTPPWTPDQARGVAMRAVATALGPFVGGGGAVHLNWPLREPLEPVGAVPVVTAIERADSADAATVAVPLDHPAMAGITGSERGVIIIGPHAGPDVEAQRAVVEAAAALATVTGWPLIGEPIAGTRRLPATLGRRPPAIAHAEQLLKIPAIAEDPTLAPDLVIRVGGSPTTKPVRMWLERHRPGRMVLIDPGERWNDPTFAATHHLVASPVRALEALISLVTGSAPGWSGPEAGRPPSATGWSAWPDLDRAAARAIEAELNGGGGFFGSAAVVDEMTSAVPDGTIVMTSNSMPVRDLDSFVRADGPAITFVGNRGASGIDGITSTALGLASAHHSPVVLFIGDLALLHDVGALFGAARLGLHLTVVCVDNDGGAIFSMLPIADRARRRADSDSHSESAFDTLFRTPHGLDLQGFDGIGGVQVMVASAEGFADELTASVARDTPGVDVLVVRIDADADIAQRRSITAAVAEAVEAMRSER